MKRLIVLAGARGPTPCLAAGGTEHWTPSSRTASAITGEVTLTASALVFAGGHSLPIRKVGNVTFTDDLGIGGPATITPSRRRPIPSCCGATASAAAPPRPRPTPTGPAASSATTLLRR